MNLQRCPNNHYYNGDKFPYCPHCCNSNVKQDNPSTIQHAIPTENISPLTAATIPYFERLTAGWLVCLNGINRGESYPLYLGDNHIGRNPNMDIRIKEEPTISRENHAIINYNQNSNTFLIQPGANSNATIINDEELKKSTQLKNRDLIQLGDCQLLFISLCDEQFSW